MWVRVRVGYGVRFKVRVGVRINLALTKTIKLNIALTCHRPGGKSFFQFPIIIPKPNFSNEGINSHCRRFELLLFAVVSQSVVAMTAFVAVPTDCWRSTVIAVTAVTGLST